LTKVKDAYLLRRRKQEKERGVKRLGEGGVWSHGGTLVTRATGKSVGREREWNIEYQASKKKKASRGSSPKTGGELG